MIPTDRALLLGFALLALAGCDRAAPPEPVPTRSAGPVAAPSDGAVAPPLDPAMRIDPPAVAASESRVVDQRDIAVADQPACALTVRYAGSIDQPATWRGEGCGKLTVRFVNMGELVALGQATKLDAAEAANLKQLPKGRVLYIEGGAASAIFPLNEVGRIYRIDLAD